MYSCAAILLQDIDDCLPNHCQNGGTCTDGVNNYTCSCVAGYSGSNCSIGKLIKLYIFNLSLIKIKLPLMFEDVDDCSLNHLSKCRNMCGLSHNYVFIHV